MIIRYLTSTFILPRPEGGEVDGVGLVVGLGVGLGVGLVVGVPVPDPETKGY